MSVTYYYADPRMFQGYSSARCDENSLLDSWFYPDRKYMEDVRKEAEKQAEAIKKKEAEANKKGGGGGKKDGDKDNENKEGGEKKGGDNKPKVIELKVPLCCESCARKVKRKIEKLDGVEKAVVCDIYEKKVTVKGTAKPEAVLKQAQKVKPDSVMWPKKEAEKKEGGDKKKNN